MAFDGRLEVTIPYEPREVFLPFHNRQQRWSITVAHRRAGKTVARVNDLIKGALTCNRPEPRFAYLAPLFTQAKDVAWAYVKRFSAPIPGVVANESELRVDFPNGGRVRLYGADNYERMRGIYLDGVVLDEFGNMDPAAWSEVIRPTLSDRQGWADFIGTPNGRNHFCEMWEKNRDNRDWYAAMLKASETNLLPASELLDARKVMTEEQYEQEYECSFQAAVIGAYYGREMSAAEKENRLAKVPWEPKLPVHTAWDLGIGDSTAIWFCQVIGKEIRLIDFLEHSGVGLDWYAKEMDRLPYKYGEHLLPHDADVKELGTGTTRIETLKSLGLKKTRIIPRQALDDGINAARLLIPKCWFDIEKCERGINALRNYRREWDDKRKVFHDRPLHDWSSHASDAFRYLAMGNPQNDNGSWSGPLKINTKGIV
jgi:hypothetical protein